MSFIVARRDVGGHRDYLDGEALSAGAGIDLYDDGLWVTDRYEANLHKGGAYFVYDDYGRERWLDIDHETMRFR